MGRIGQAVAARAPAFGMDVAYCSADPVVLSYSGVPPLPPMQRMALDQLLSTSHVVTLHVPLTPETRHLVDQRALVRMRRSAYLINTSRGPVVDEAALAWALRERVISGAGLDVYEREPTVHADLLGLENVVLAPHLGSGTTETRTAMADLAARNVLAVLAGEPPLTPVPAG
jgi:glyoxylate reductase